MPPKLPSPSASRSPRSRPGRRSDRPRRWRRRRSTRPATSPPGCDPARIREIGLGAATRGLAETAGIPVEVRFDPAILPPGLLEPEREIDLYRILQEAIGNAARHSHARHVWIDGRVGDGLIHLTVGDDGVGFDQSAMARGLGLAGIHERADILLGRVDVQSSPGAGTIVDVTIPVLTVPAGDLPPVGDLPAPHPAV